jgi:hypothetical protein
LTAARPNITTIKPQGSPMQFRTEIPIPKGNNPIDYHSQILSLGSCFAENMSDKFGYFNFRNTVNPFGILFHAPAIEKTLRFAVNQKEFTESDIFFHNERWQCFDAHSDLSSPDKNELLANLNKTSALTHQQIIQATHVVITIGTSWGYRQKDSGNLVANCHKIPQKEFTKELLSEAANAESLQNTIQLLNTANSGIQIILTVSPVRHIKDGFAENQWSKANLISAVRNVIAENPSAAYFPSYEIMMDELRDYRFYAEDMLHPNQTAIDYIWEKFFTAWISPTEFPVMEEVRAIRKALAHRPFHPNSESHHAFLDSVRRKATLLQGKFPHMQF